MAFGTRTLIGLASDDMQVAGRRGGGCVVAVVTLFVVVVIYYYYYYYSYFIIFIINFIINPADDYDTYTTTFPPEPVAFIP